MILLLSFMSCFVDGIVLPLKHSERGFLGPIAWLYTFLTREASLARSSLATHFMTIPGRLPTSSLLQMKPLQNTAIPSTMRDQFCLFRAITCTKTFRDREPTRSC